ncbi:alpha/beta hydrolase [Porphyromonadaceae bacterium OttesenSCG-928-L07]|nr:alpha/beta hydrolase [Porphyromonadaceae bacterium OttesenSCG-928-L07]MDL2252190.1 alpha/beta hydrolase [Odoribacter sp. OttesenSCG-928-J03]
MSEELKQEFDLDVDGVILRVARVEAYTDRPTIVFLHESFGCIDHWKNFPFDMGEAAQCNVVVYDRQGYGKSTPFTITERDKDYLEKEADVLHKVLNLLNIKDAVLFGHSDGGSIALIAAAKYPEGIRAVITEGAHVFVEEITLAGIRQAIVFYQEGKLKNALAKYHGDKTDMVFKLWAETWLSERFCDWNIECFLPQISCPVLVVQGDHDEYGTVEQVNSILNHSSGRSEKFMPDAGHTPHREKADELIEAVVKFLRTR